MCAGQDVYCDLQPPIRSHTWHGLVRGDYGIDVIVRIFAPDLERFAEWKPPVAKNLQRQRSNVSC
jgi:hypothetical protein